MRLVGERSLASVLRFGLGVVDAFVVIGVVVISVALAVSVISPDYAAGFRDGFDRGSDSLVTLAGPWDLVMALPSLVFVWWILNRLQRILASVNLGDAFEHANVRRLQMVGVGLIGLQLTSYVQTLGRPFAEGGGTAGFRVDLSMWLAILVVFILAEVFRQGAQMRDDAQMTV